MNSIYSIRKFKGGTLLHALRFVLILTLAYLLASVPMATYAGIPTVEKSFQGNWDVSGVMKQAPSPIIGNWQAVDIDESDIRLAIAGPPTGPFQITLTESYISYCDGGPGIVRGTGWLAEGDPSVLEADLRLLCFRTGATLDFHATWIYDPGTDTISSDFITWHRPSAASKACLPHAYGLTNWWPGDGDAADIVSGMDGSFQGNATSGSGLVDLSFHLHGEGDFIDVPHQAGLDLGYRDFTVDLWVNFNDTAREQVLVEKWIQSDPSQGWTLTKLDGDVLRLATGDGKGIEINLDSRSLALRPGVWYHFAATRLGSEITLYLNGEPVAYSPDMGVLNLSSESSLKFGHRGNPDDTPGSGDERGFYLNGRIDEVELFVGTALSGDQVRAIYQAGSAGKCKDQVQAPPPLLNPFIVASTQGDWFWTSDFIPGAELAISIFESPEPGVAMLWSGSSQTDEYGFIIVGYDKHGVDLLPGHYLVISDRWHTKTLVLELITMEVFDTDDEIMAGTAPPGREVSAAAGLQDYQDRISVVADPETGQWLADFKTIVLDITEEMRPWSFAQIFDEDGDANEAGAPPPPPTPRMYVFPEWDYIIAWDWPPESTVTAEVYHPGSDEIPDCSTTAQVMPPGWDENQYVAEFILWEICDLHAGDYILLTDGISTKEHFVFPLQVTWLDPDADMIGGSALPGFDMQAWVHGEESTNRYFQPEEDGSWAAGFSPFDLAPGMGGRAEQYDEDGDATSVDWQVPYMVVIAFPEAENVFGYGWPVEQPVSMEIDDPGTEEPVDFSQEVTVGPAPWDPNDIMASFNFSGLYDLKPGDFVTLSDGVTTRTHKVENLSVSGVNGEDNTVSGSADPGKEVHVWVHGYGESDIYFLVDEETWTLDFDDIGFDLQPGMCGRVEIRDDGGNATAIDWCVYNPRFTVFTEWEAIEGWEWPLGATVHLEIDDPVTGDSPDYWQDEAVVPTPWDPNQSWVTFNFAGLYDVKAGDLVTLSDETTTRSHTVRNLAVTALDLQENTITGLADDGALVYVWPHDAWFEPLQAIADASDAWEVDLDDVGYDLVEGASGRSEIRDGIGNATAVDWYVPNPRFTVWPESDHMDGFEWPDGPVTVTVEGKPICSTEKISEGGYFNEPFPEGCDITVGDVVTFFDGVTTRSHTVRNLAVTAVDPAVDTVAGTADIGEVVSVGAYGFGGEYELQLTAEDGAWLADFTLTGIDLVEGMCGYARVDDVVGNVTQVDWCVPNPRLVASISEDWFFLVDFSPNTSITFKVYQSQGGDEVWTGGRVTDGSGFLWVNPDEENPWNWDMDIL
jgi:hypothetical protein